MIAVEGPLFRSAILDRKLQAVRMVALGKRHLPERPGKSPLGSLCGNRERGDQNQRRYHPPPRKPVFVVCFATPFMHGYCF